MKTALLFYSENFLGGAERRLLRVYREISNSEFQCDVIVIGCNKFRFQEILKKADSRLREIDEEYRTTIINTSKYGTVLLTTAMITELSPEEQNQIVMYLCNNI